MQRKEGKREKQKRGLKNGQTASGKREESGERLRRQETEGERDKNRGRGRLFCKLLIDKDRLFLFGRCCLVGGLRLLQRCQVCVPLT